MWVRDFLRPDLDHHVDGGIRILTYGYDSTLLDNDSNAGISEYSRSFLEAIENARRLRHVLKIHCLNSQRELTLPNQEKRRPIVFVAHSLGGIVVKEVSSCVPACVQASLD